MLKLTIKPGEYINIGDDVRVIYSGGSEGNIHLLIDAPRELNIVRSKVLARNTANSDKKESRYISPYYAERGLSPETLSKIRRLIREDKKMNKQVIGRKDDINQDMIKQQEHSQQTEKLLKQQVQLILRLLQHRLEMH